jgi:hypothetical protein
MFAREGRRSGGKKNTAMAKKLVCNALNTSKYDSIDGMSCIDYWCNTHNQNSAEFCRACGERAKDGDDIIGAHVMSLNETPRHVYIVPMHRSCNSKQADLGSFEVDEYNLSSVPSTQENKILNDPDNVNLRTDLLVNDILFE